MSATDDATTTNVDHLLAAARETTAGATHWLAATPAADGGVSVRVVEPIPGIPGEADWTIWFATSGASRKAAEIRRGGRLTLGYQRHTDQAYVALLGRAALVEDRPTIRGRWNESWRVYFPRGPDDPNTVFVKLDVDRIELCIPGVSPEPFGSRYATIVRDPTRRWTIVQS